MNPADSTAVPQAPVRILRSGAVFAGVAFLLFAAAVMLPWTQQAVLGASLLAVALLLKRSSGSQRVTLLPLLLSCFATLRYCLWRVTTVSHLFRGAAIHPVSLDAVFAALLLCAELFCFLTMGLGYFQMLSPMRRPPAALPADIALWPEVDLLITTLDEPLHLVKYTALAARNIDWPADRLNVYVLDDGRRPEFRDFCARAGIGYMIRDDLQFAKAGNLNRALARLSAPLVAVFDADQVPTRSFLQTTAGWFLRDPKLGMLQTPHHLYSQDPFERNLPDSRDLPNEGELFYGVVQDGNDLWNAAYFCGSCAVMRRAALDDVGGIAVETLTEDVHTSLRMQKRGWNTAYLNLPQAAGLATERLSGHIRQRVRWARGMVQVLRLENPLFARGLTSSQRLCYFHAMAHFLYALPRLIFLTVPLLTLLFGLNVFPGYWMAAVAYAAPHLLLLHLAHARLQGRYRQSFWNEIYETVLAPYILLPTIGAFLFPRWSRFNVTAKGTVVEESFFDTRIGWPFLILFVANLAGLAVGTVRLLASAGVNQVNRLPVRWLHSLAAHQHPVQPGLIALNLLWTVFNLILVSVAIGAARERQQRRRAVRLSRSMAVTVL
ncbi:MAG TPA: glycosyltransferase family 2 protein, partial [Acidobacteriaceae bacterium]|nr:glycosyltransferase family 2 protein [Acidobacteriaceae bacterium]